MLSFQNGDPLPTATPNSYIRSPNLYVASVTADTNFSCYRTVPLLEQTFLRGHFVVKVIKDNATSTIAGEWSVVASEVDGEPFVSAYR